MSILLVRHARAKGRASWEGDDSKRPLTKAGRAQAEGLVRLLSAYEPAHILSSPFVRCAKTVEPLARSLGLTVEITESLAEGHVVATLLLLRRFEHETAVACTHGDVIPEVLLALAQRDGMSLPADVRCAKGSTWVLDSVAGDFAAAAYLEPPPAR